MSKQVLSSVVAVACGFFALSASAECTYPKGPDAMPDGAKASEAEMRTAIDAFKAYNDAVTAYGSCLDQETTEKTAAMQPGQVRQLKSIQNKKYTSAVEELKVKAEQFNAQVRAFKARG